MAINKRYSSIIPLTVSFAASGLSSIFADSTPPSLIETPSNRSPSVYGWGVQFDLENAFVTDLSSEGVPLFYTTHTGGKKWNELMVLDGGKKVGWNWTNDLSVQYYNGDDALFYYKGYFYDNRGRLSRNTSTSLRGKEGLRIDSVPDNRKGRKLLRTFDGAKQWLDTGFQNPPFDSVQTFDPVSKNTILACIYITDIISEQRKEVIAISVDAAKSWKIASELKGEDIRGDHTFFSDTQRGWISSDCDDGIF